MSDVKDILGVCKAPTAADPGKSKSSEKKPTRPEWMSREAFALLDTTHPIVPSALSVNKGPKGIREKPKASARGKITWQWQAFRNPARQDGLELMHWVKCFKDVSGRIRAAEEGEYPFAKFNKKPAMVMYTDEEYNSLLAVSDAKWSRAETDYLMGLCEQFDLRWPVIADRFHFDGGPPRTMEELKSRYYSLARLLLIARNGEDNVANLEVVRNPYNFAHEVDRKRQLALAWARSTGMENPEDARVLEEAAAIEARQAEVAQAPPPSAGAADPEQKAAAASAAAAVARPEPPSEEGFPSIFSPQGVPIKLKPGVYVRSAHTHETGATQVAGLIGGTRAQRTVDGTLAELGIKGPPTVSTRAVCGAWLALRAEVIQVLELKKRLQNRHGGAADDKRKRKGAGPDGRPGKRNRA